jgi:succinate dehydrogenase / fumarate reductase flavoprotein subunit
MGGIPTDADGRVVTTVDGEDRVIRGFFAAGECSCASVHGANRLGTNSLLEATVFGRRTGQTIADFLQNEAPSRSDFAPMPAWAQQQAEDEVAELLHRQGNQNAADIRRELQETMFFNAGVFRSPDKLEVELAIIGDLRERFNRISLDDKGKHYNTELIETLELAHMLDFAECIVAGALIRQESRGAHARRDFPKRDDENWMKHTLAFRGPDGRPQLDYKPVRYGPEGPRFQPEERKY